MKQFAVLKKIGDFDAKVIREFDTRDDAVQFANLLIKSEQSEYVSYYVACDIVSVTGLAG